MSSERWTIKAFRCSAFSVRLWDSPRQETVPILLLPACHFHPQVLEVLEQCVHVDREVRGSGRSSRRMSISRLGILPRSHKALMVLKKRFQLQQSLVSARSPISSPFDSLNS